MIPSIRDQRSRLAPVTPPAPALVALDLNDERLVRALRVRGTTPAVVLHILAEHGLPLTHSHNTPPIGDQLPERWYVAVVPEDGGSVA